MARSIFFSLFDFSLSLSSICWQAVSPKSPKFLIFFPFCPFYFISIFIHFFLAVGWYHQRPCGVYRVLPSFFFVDDDLLRVVDGKKWFGNRVLPNFDEDWVVENEAKRRWKGIQVRRIPFFFLAKMEYRSKNKNKSELLLLENRWQISKRKLGKYRSELQESPLTK